jgi:hypothetical protein
MPMPAAATVGEELISSFGSHGHAASSSSVAKYPVRTVSALPVTLVALRQDWKAMPFPVDNKYIMQTEEQLYWLSLKTLLPILTTKSPRHQESSVSW